MQDDVIETARLFSLHTQLCSGCNQPGQFCCPKGLKLLEDFHAALHALLSQRPYDA